MKNELMHFIGNNLSEQFESSQGLKLYQLSRCFFFNKQSSVTIDNFIRLDDVQV